MGLLIRYVELAQRVGNIKFILYEREDKPLVEGVAQLYYIGNIVDHTDND